MCYALSGTDCVSPRPRYPVPTEAMVLPGRTSRARRIPNPSVPDTRWGQSAIAYARNPVLGRRCVVAMPGADIGDGRNSRC
eukprot:2747803-Rhodomonas_salina.3